MSSIKSPKHYYPPDRQKNKTEKGTLYLVGTPIGNLADLSERARKVLSEGDFIGGYAKFRQTPCLLRDQKAYDQLF